MASFLPMLDALVNTQVTEFVEDSAGTSVYDWTNLHMNDLQHQRGR